MKISTITVAFNEITGVEKTIRSVLRQTYSDIEYIIIDGGSTDGTAEVIAKYADKLSYWVSERDGGIDPMWGHAWFYQMSAYPIQARRDTGQVGFPHQVYRYLKYRHVLPFLHKIRGK